MARQQVAIQQQLGNMEKKRRVFHFFQNQSYTHFVLINVETHVILVKPCGFCKT
jgi:hypothetical protein